MYAKFKFKTKVFSTNYGKSDFFQFTDSLTVVQHMALHNPDS